MHVGGGGGGGGGPASSGGGGGGGGGGTPEAAAQRAHLSSLLQQVGSLRAQVEAFQQAKQDDIDWRTYGYHDSEAPRTDYTLAVRSRLGGGHAGRVTALAWAGDNTTLASVGTDGVLVLWNAIKGAPEAAAVLPDEDVPTCVDVEKGGETPLVLVGGLNQVCHVYRLDRLRGARGSTPKPRTSLPAAGGALSCVRALGGECVLVGGADGLLRVWDLSARYLKRTLDGRGGPVTCAAVMPQENDAPVVASGHGDGRLRVWDTRLSEARACVLAFGGFQGGGVTAVDFFPAGTAVAAGGADSSVRLYDLRACGPVGVFCDARRRVGVTGLAFSASGALLFASYEYPVVLAWEPLSADGAVFDMKSDFSKPVHCVAANGLALAVGGEEADRPSAEIVCWA